MGSDSRTATATSSKPRPSWRDRHLSQLTDEQLSDVKKHRAGAGSGDETGSETADRPVANKSSDQARATAAQLAGVDGSETAARQSKYSEPKVPRQQAGPDRDSGRESRSERSDDRDGNRANSQPRNQNRGRPVNRGRESYSGHPQERRPEGERERAQVRAPSRPPHAREPEHDQRTYRQKHDDYREHNRHGTGRDGIDRGTREPGNRHDRRRRDTYRHDSDAPAPKHQDRPKTATDSTPAPEQTATAPKKSLVNRLLDFQLKAPVKYGLMALAIAVMIAVSLMKPIDNSSQSQLDSALTRAMIGFGLARTLNGVISVAQGTEFAVQPAGVGVNFSPGEILDPINDLVERFSWVMLLATSSLGVQKILLEVSSWAGISVLLGGAGLFFLLTRMRNSSMARLADIAGKILLVMILVRFLIPVGSLANDWVYKQFLQPQYEQSSEQLEIASTRIREISARQTQSEKNDGSLKERAKSLYNSMTSKFDFDGMLKDYKDSAENVSEHAVSLIVVFTLQTIVFPLLFLYLIYRLFRAVLLPSRT